MSGEAQKQIKAVVDRMLMFIADMPGISAAPEGASSRLIRKWANEIKAILKAEEKAA